LAGKGLEEFLVALFTSPHQRTRELECSAAFTRQVARAVLVCLCLGLAIAGCGRKHLPTALPDPTLAVTATPSPGPETADPVTSTPTSTPTLTPTPSPVPTSTATPTLTPSPTPSPTPTTRRPVVAFVSDVSGDDDVYLLDVETDEVLNLTSDPAEDRDPAFAPDGQALIFRSNTSGSWAFYRIDLATGARTALADPGMDAAAYKGHLTWSAVGGYEYAYESYQDGNLNLYVRDQGGAHRALTQHRAGDYEPAWRPDSSQVAFASWREGQKDLYLIDADGENLTRLTTDLADEEDPAWHPDGQHLAFVRWVEYDADLYELDLGSGEVTRLTQDPYPDRSPTYAPDGTLFWTRYVPGQAFEVHDPYYPGQWQLWMRGADGQERPVALPAAGMDVYTPAAGLALWPGQEFSPLQVPTPAPTYVPGDLPGVVLLDVDCAGGNPRINASLVDAYQAWRDDAVNQTGYDVLGTVSDMFRPIGYSKSNYGTLSWHRTGRAVDLLFEWFDPADKRDRFREVREDLGAQTYWRLYILARDQDGTMGEPLTVSPWIFWFNLSKTQEPDAYAQGGKPDVIPPGYYVDLTRLAKRHGWYRIASYEEADFDWKTDSVGREFWHYQRIDGLTWWQAMGQIYSQETLESSYGWAICTELGMDPAWLEAKGIPTPSPTP
jgi:TolB protein